jgi:hypothetical protein
MNCSKSSLSLSKSIVCGTYENRFSIASLRIQLPISYNNSNSNIPDFKNESSISKLYSVSGDVLINK